MNNLKQQEMLEMREYVGLRYKAKRQADEAKHAAKKHNFSNEDLASGQCDICLKDTAEKNFQKEVEMNYVSGFSEVNKKPHNRYFKNQTQGRLRPSPFPKHQVCSSQDEIPYLSWTKKQEELIQNIR